MQTPKLQKKKADIEIDLRAGVKTGDMVVTQRSGIKGHKKKPQSSIIKSIDMNSDNCKNMH